MPVPLFRCRKKHLTAANFGIIICNSFRLVAYPHVLSGICIIKECKGESDALKYPIINIMPFNSAALR
jgi:hypothetical protein